MSGSIASIVGCSLMAVFCLVAVPMLGHYTDPCNAVNFPPVGNAFTLEECYDLLAAVPKAAPEAKVEAAKDLIFFFTLVARIEAGCLMAMGLGAAYTMTLKMEQRHPGLFILACAAVFAACVDFSHAGVLPLGGNAMVTRKALAASTPLGEFWGTVAVLLWKGFFDSRAAAAAKAKTE